MKSIPYHPFSNIMPLMSDEEQAALEESIRTSEQTEPITLFQGKILDGRHRYEKCVRCGKTPKFKEFKGTQIEALDLVKSHHCRRNLNESQRSLVAAKIAKIRLDLISADLPKETNDDDKDQQANLPSVTAIREQEAIDNNVSRRLVDSASKVLDEAPKKIIAAVESGKMSVHAAEKVVNEKRAKKETVLDETNWEIPEELQPLWSRRNEVMEMLKSVAGMRNKLEEFQKTKDLLFSTVRFTDAMMALDRAHQEIKNAQLWAVCTSCQGRDPSRCKLCKGRGILSKFAWDTFVPAEIKVIRSKKP